MNRHPAAILSISVLCMLEACSSKPAAPEKVVADVPAVINEIPDIVIIEEGGNQFPATSLPGKSVLIFFSPDCDHCQREAAQIHDHLQAFESYGIYFISMDTFDAIDRFAQTYKLDNQPGVHFVRADGRTVFAAMGPMKTPTICVYTINKKLAKRFDGETKIEEILKVL